MGKLAAAVADLARWQKIDARYEDGEAIIRIRDDSIFVSEDEEFDRTVFWAHVAKGVASEPFGAAVTSIAFNEHLAADRGLTLGVSLDADCAIVGRSIEIDNLDSVRLLAEAQTFHSDLLVTKAFFQNALAGMRREQAEAQELDDDDDPSDNYVRI